nr:site-specific integrase [uncultured Hyphomonas sp.]
MAQSSSPQVTGMSLFTARGERKYISQSERVRFLSALTTLDDEAERTYCEMLFWTGCRPSEALALTAQHVDLDERAVAICSLKKRGKLKGRHFRIIPLPDPFIKRLEAAHGIKAAQAKGCEAQPLWSFCRTTAWRRMRSVMWTAKISGIRATGRGLRHAFGVQAVMGNVPLPMIQKWLGHANLHTTAIYLNASGPEDRAVARRMWKTSA